MSGEDPSPGSAIATGVATMTATVRVPTDRPGLSARSRGLLERRLRDLEERIPKLERELASWPEDPHTAAALLVARDEATRLGSTLAAAVPLEDLPDDPAVVEIGDTVTLRRPRAKTRERFTIVHEPEARLDDTWISARSPLGAAVLGRRAGDVVEVRTPDGLVRYEVVTVKRVEATS